METMKKKKTLNQSNCSPSGYICKILDPGDTEEEGMNRL